MSTPDQAQENQSADPQEEFPPSLVHMQNSPDLIVAHVTQLAVSEVVSPDNSHQLGRGPVSERQSPHTLNDLDAIHGVLGEVQPLSIHAVGAEYCDWIIKNKAAERNSHSHNVGVEADGHVVTCRCCDFFYSGFQFL